METIITDPHETALSGQPVFIIKDTKGEGNKIHNFLKINK